MKSFGQRFFYQFVVNTVCDVREIRRCSADFLCEGNRFCNAKMHVGGLVAQRAEHQDRNALQPLKYALAITAYVGYVRKVAKAKSRHLHMCLKITQIVDVELFKGNVSKIVRKDVEVKLSRNAP